MTSLLTSSSYFSENTHEQHYVWAYVDYQCVILLHAALCTLFVDFCVCFLAQICERVSSISLYWESELYMRWSAELCSCTCDGESSCQCGFIHIFWINVDCVIPLFYMSLCECVSFRLSGAVGGHRSDSALQAEQIINRDGRRETRVQIGTLAYCLPHSIHLIFTNIYMKQYTLYSLKHKIK